MIARTERIAGFLVELLFEVMLLAAEEDDADGSGEMNDWCSAGTIGAAAAPRIPMRR